MSTFYVGGICGCVYVFECVRVSVLVVFLNRYLFPRLHFPIIYRFTFLIFLHGVVTRNVFSYVYGVFNRDTVQVIFVVTTDSVCGVVKKQREIATLRLM